MRLPQSLPLLRNDGVEVLFGTVATVNAQPFRPRSGWSPNPSPLDVLVVPTPAPYPPEKSPRTIPPSGRPRIS